MNGVYQDGSLFGTVSEENGGKKINKRGGKNKCGGKIEMKKEFVIFPVLFC
jgi:hypothetical protein